MQCQINLPHTQLYSGEVEIVTLPTVEGEIGVLKGHMPLVVLLQTGVITVQSVGNAESHKFHIVEGVAHITPEEALVMISELQ